MSFFISLICKWYTDTKGKNVLSALHWIYKKKLLIYIVWPT